MPAGNTAPPAGARLVAAGGGLLFVAALAATVWRFQQLGNAPETAGPAARAVAVDTALFAAFALHHSVMARDRVKARLVRLIPPALERSSYVWAASLLLLLVCVLWQPVPGHLYSVPPPWSWLLVACQLAGLGLIVDAVSRIDPFELAGIRQVWGPRTAPPQGRDPLVLRGSYRVVRHPVYLGWLLLTWGAPTMTGGRLLFDLLSAVYLAAAVPFEERSLLRRFGPAYDDYRARVRWRMLPGVF